MNTLKPVSDLTPEEQMQFVRDQIATLLNGTHLLGRDPPTREEIRAANERLMLLSLTTYNDTLRVAVEAGVVVTELRLSFAAHWNQDLQCLVLDGVDAQHECQCPHPIKRLYGVYRVEDPNSKPDRPGI